VSEQGRASVDGLEAGWDLRTYRLPKRVEEDPAGAGMLTRIAETAKRVHPSSGSTLPHGTLFGPLAATLEVAREKGQLQQGLESAQRKLELEQRGLSMVDQRSGQTRGERISRLVLCSNDGAERFYRHVELLLKNHRPRVIAVVLDIDAVQMGQRIFGSEKIVRLVLSSQGSGVGCTSRPVSSERSPGLRRGQTTGPNRQAR